MIARLICDHFGHARADSRTDTKMFLNYATAPVWQYPRCKCITNGSRTFQHTVGTNS
jgi:hypothetical protein